MQKISTHYSKNKIKTNYRVHILNKYVSKAFVRFRSLRIEHSCYKKDQRLFASCQEKSNQSPITHSFLKTIFHSQPCNMHPVFNLLCGRYNNHEYNPAFLQSPRTLSIGKRCMAQRFTHCLPYLWPAKCRQRQCNVDMPCPYR